VRSLLKPAAALAAAFLVTFSAGCGENVTAPRQAPAIDVGTLADTPNADLGVPGTTSAVTTRVNSGQCLDVWGAQLVAGAPVALHSCHGGANQQFTWTAAGEMRAGGLCVDAWGGAGRAGDQLVLWNCNGGANQKWALSAAGELRGVNNRCIDVFRFDASNGARPVLWDCNGGANQKWDTRGGTPATPAPAPAPAPAPPTSGGAAAVLSLMGQTPSVSSVEALGGAFARYEQDFRTYADRHWASEGTSVAANYYDRAMMYYVWWARTGNATYLERANALAVNYRKSFLEARGFNVLPYETFVDGVALHYLVTGDEASRAAVGKVADRFATSRFMDVLGNTAGEVDNRDQSRVLTALLVARRINAPTAAGNDWAGRARTALSNILRSQSSDGAYRFAQSGQCGYNKPWMVGLLNDALVRYHTSFEADSRIVGAVKRSLDYIWANDWRDAQQSIVYLGGNCGGDSPYTAPDLNNLVSSGFGFVYRQTGDATYRTRGDAVFIGGVNGGWPAGSKQFNQEYTSSYRYLGLR
jgi:hypothetical protein